MIDAHAHYTLPDSQVFPPDALVAKLDAAGVTRLVVTSQPPALAQALYRHAPARILPILGVYDHGLDKAHWVHDPTLQARVEAALDAGHWAGLGELHLFAADAEQPVFEALVNLAAERNLVLLLHGDPEIVRHAFSIAPGVRILWAHLGTDPRPETLAPLLAQYPQLWIDTSVRDERIAPNGHLLPEWHALFERHPTRVVVAVDTFSTHRWQHYGEVVDAIRHWAGSLSPGLQRRLLHDNAAQLFDAFPAAPGRP
ncbi:MAG TPA: amidohydrolase family protein [Thiobacillus sp.]|nr:amidohydrolase family protein [Thiobacillus sp.]